MKICSKCSEPKPTNQFYKCGGGYRRTWCKSCNKTLRRTSYAEQDVRYGMLWRAQYRTKIHNLPAMNITIADFEVPTHCPILGIPLFVGKKGGGDNSPSLDQIVPGDGYVKGNVQVMSTKANAMKSNATPEELLSFANWVKQIYGN